MRRAVHACFLFGSLGRNAQAPVRGRANNAAIRTLNNRGWLAYPKCKSASRAAALRRETTAVCLRAHAWAPAPPRAAAQRTQRLPSRRSGRLPRTRATCAAHTRACHTASIAVDGCCALVSVASCRAVDEAAQIGHTFGLIDARCGSVAAIHQLWRGPRVREAGEPLMEFRPELAPLSFRRAGSDAEHVGMRLGALHLRRGEEAEGACAAPVSENISGRRTQRAQRCGRRTWRSERCSSSRSENTSGRSVRRSELSTREHEPSSKSAARCKRTHTGEDLTEYARQ